MNPDDLQKQLAELMQVVSEEQALRKEANGHANKPKLSSPIEKASKQASPVDRPSHTLLAAAKVSWSTSARPEADLKTLQTAQPLKDLLPTRYHQHLRMFRKTKAPRLPPVGSTISRLTYCQRDNLPDDVPMGSPSAVHRKKRWEPLPMLQLPEAECGHCQEPIPSTLTMDLVDSLPNANQFTKLDLRNAYGNLHVAEGNKEKLAFICKAAHHAALPVLSLISSP
ncbi:hypothetical protein PCASD_02595 [Puccinia coronata f. sp. avenae]|uniref:Reverse transcriptase domain-containing protein n=1 Tax=Puccinia coronata f. sp. avenae TaxID=200324 RepID=A0A2N5VBF8_9BASI|nr:hypothetical protein PCASD_02595 [Puccinia coronata f. sp. avenae]